jgi:predicted acyl esterase
MSTSSSSAVVTIHEPAEPDAKGGSATFTSSALAADHSLLGHAELHLRATLSAPDASFYVELIDLDDKNRETLVNDGFLKASHHESDTDPKPVAAGVPFDYVVPIRAHHYRFVAGHSVRLRISGGKSTSLVPAATPVDIMIQTGSASTLHLSPAW